MCCCKRCGKNERSKSKGNLRAGAGLVITGLRAEGVTEITDIHYIDRGYENFDGKLRGIGADIIRINEQAVQ